MKALPAVLLVLAGLAAPACAVAAPAPARDALTACLVQHSSEQDRTLLIRWVVAAITRHPQVRDLSRMTPEQGDQLNRDVATMFMRLLADDCGEQTREAIRNEGRDTIKESFGTLARVAMRGLLEDAEVDAYFSQWVDHMDEDKIAELFSPEPAAPVDAVEAGALVEAGEGAEPVEKN